MFLEASKNRAVIFPKKKALETIDQMSPLTVQEIFKAVSFQLRKCGNKFVEIYRPYFDIWLLFLKEIGEKNLKRAYLQPETTHPVFDQSDGFALFKSFKTFDNFHKNTENFSKTDSLIKPIKNRSYQPPYRAEANIIINNTENIQEIVVDRDIEEKPKNSDYFAKTVNGHFVEPHSRRTNDYKSITFYTQKYYQESLRLSKKPELYQTQSKNPILTYIPENFDFQLNKEKEKNALMIKKSSALSAVYLKLKNLIYLNFLKKTKILLNCKDFSSYHFLHL